MKVILTIEDAIEILNKHNHNFVKYEDGYIYFTCKRHKENGVQKIKMERIVNITNPCKPCIYNRQTLEDILAIDAITKDVEILSKKIVNVDTKILCRCKHCGHEWWITPAKLKSGRRCPECRKVTLRKLKQKKPEVIQKELQENNPNVEIIGEYVNSQQMIRCRCKIHNIKWESHTWNILHGLAGCPVCNSSRGENEVAIVLDELGIKYIRQHSFSDCIYKAKLKFDFYLPDYNICIEYQGEQHYFPVNFKGHGNVDYLKEHENNLIRDNIKREYCSKNNILLLEIPYYEFDNIKNILLCYIENP